MATDKKRSPALWAGLRVSKKSDSDFPAPRSKRAGGPFVAHGRTIRRTSSASTRKRGLAGPLSHYPPGQRFARHHFLDSLSPALWAGLLLGLGLGYALFVRVTGLMVPCPFLLVTGLYCPGCGVSRMCLALLSGDLAGAWRANPALLLALPALGGLLLWTGLTGHRGRPKATRGQLIATWGLVVYFLVFGVLRNLPGFAGLRPV